MMRVPNRISGMKIISGGQTGVDRAALDIGLELGIELGGWCPNGRLAEDGPIAKKYPLKETPSSEYIQRTQWNVRDADGVLIITWGEASGGTKQAIEFCAHLKKPLLHIDLKTNDEIHPVRNWINLHKIETLSIGGPRESEAAGIYEVCKQFLRRLLKE